MNNHCSKMNDPLFKNEQPIPDTNPDKNQHIETPLPPIDKKRNTLDAVMDEAGLSPARKEAVDLWLSYKQERKQPYKPVGLKVLLNKWAKVSDSEFEAAVTNSISNNYSGIFAVKSGGVLHQAQPSRSEPKRKYIDPDDPFGFKKKAAAQDG